MSAVANHSWLPGAKKGGCRGVLCTTFSTSKHVDAEKVTDEGARSSEAMASSCINK